MKTKNRSVGLIMFILTVLTLSPISQAEAQQPAAEAQFRFLLHKQHVKEGKSIGVAGWCGAPNLMAPKGVSTYCVGGVAFQGNGPRKGDSRWIEVLMGVVILPNGEEFHPAVTVRSAASVLGGKMDGYAEIFYNTVTGISTLQPKFGVALSIAPVRLGGEVDVVLDENARVLSATGGPRIILPFKLSRDERKKSSLAVAYHHFSRGEKPRFMRAYLVLKF